MKTFPENHTIFVEIAYLVLKDLTVKGLLKIEIAIKIMPVCVTHISHNKSL